MASLADKPKMELTPEQIRVYRQHFEVFDLNGDGVISAKELMKVARKLGYRLSDDQIMEIMKANDLDSNGCLSFDEFLQAMPANIVNIPEEEHRMAEIRRKFMEYDQDGNGVVTMQEAHDILQKELSFSPQQSIELVRRYDKNGDGQLSYEEFAKFYDKVKSKAAQIKLMFEEFDKDGSGAISVDEAKVMLQRLDIPEEEVETLVSMYDTNQDGELQYEEFVKFLLHA